jgi:hypothetical protein
MVFKASIKNLAKALNAFRILDTRYNEGAIHFESRLTNTLAYYTNALNWG